MRLELVDGVHQAKRLFLIAPRARITQIEQHHVAPLPQIAQPAGLEVAHSPGRKGRTQSPRDRVRQAGILADEADIDGWMTVGCSVDGCVAQSSASIDNPKAGTGRCRDRYGHGVARKNKLSVGLAQPYSPRSRISRRRYVCSVGRWQAGAKRCPKGCSWAVNPS